jgi:hypothetical protein
MQIVDIKTSKDCFNKSLIKIITTDKTISRKSLEVFRELGDLKLYEFMNPLFVVKNPDSWEIKGLLNDNKFKITLFKDDWADLLKKIIRSFNTFYSN